MPDWNTHLTFAFDDHVLSAWLFLRLLGCVYLAAFLSLALQVRGLIGHRGILPADEYLRSHRRFGRQRFLIRPTVFWLNCGDAALEGVCWLGTLLSILVIVGLLPLPCLILLWLLYLSLHTVGRVFLSYQWDILLLEAGFLAIFLAPFDFITRIPPATAPSPVIMWLLYWLLFRLMFSSGVSKLRSGDRSWRTLTALCHHYQTQPLPTPPAWHAHQAPAWFHRLSAAILFAIELAVPFLIFSPYPWMAAFPIIALMILIAITGNYAFFNLLTVALAILLLDDHWFLPGLSELFPTLAWDRAIEPGWPWWIVIWPALLVALLSLERVANLFRVEFPWPRRVTGWLTWLQSFPLVNSYGLFAHMTTQRPEIILEASHDGAEWWECEFRHKAGDVKRRPRFIAPLQPRLDWQMWFAALGVPQRNQWFQVLLLRLLQGSPHVVRLLAMNPFHKPPRYLRAVLHEYRFTTRAEYRATKAWWHRERRGLYCPPVTLPED